MTSAQKKIIIVDDNDTNLTACKKILKPFYEVFPAPSAKKLFDLLEHVVPDLLILDVDMPDLNGYEVAGRLKLNDVHKRIPIIFLSGRVDPTSELFGLNMGALDYIHKPFVSELLLKRIKAHLSLIERNRSIQEMRASVNGIIDLLGTARGADPEKVKECLEKAENSSKNLLELIDSVIGDA